MSLLAASQEILQPKVTGRGAQRTALSLTGVIGSRGREGGAGTWSYTRLQCSDGSKGAGEISSETSWP